MGLNSGDKRNWAPPVTGVAVAASLYFTGGGKAFVYSFSKGLRKYFVPPGDDDIDPDGSGFGGSLRSGTESNGLDLHELAIDATLGLMVAGVLYALMSRRGSAHA